MSCYYLCTLSIMAENEIKFGGFPILRMKNVNWRIFKREKPFTSRRHQRLYGPEQHRPLGAPELYKI